MASPQAEAPAAPQPTITFVLRPPPVTLWLQFDDGSRLAVSPTPEYIASSVMGIPVMGGLPILMTPGLFGGAGGFERQLHELFMRTQNQQQGPPPTSKTFLDKIPLKTWTDKMKKDEKCTDCSICLCDYEENDQVLPLPCGHQFHNECGMKWLLEHNVCPTCRYALPTEESSSAKPVATENSTPTSVPAAATQEPEAEDDVPDHPASAHARPTSSHSECTTTEDQAMDTLLEDEANRFVAEEQEKQRVADVTFDDSDIEELLHDTSS